MTTTDTERPGFDRRMAREEINALPMRRFDGVVEVVTEQDHLAEALKCLEQEPVLGFDTETRPSFAKGESYDPSLVQLAGSKMTYVIQLKPVEFPVSLRRLLANEKIIKAGVAPYHDLNELQRLGEFEPAGIVDLATGAKNLGIKNHGLRGLAAVLLGFRISKSSQVSNWARRDLTEAQVSYAAMDAWVSRELYLHLDKMGAEMKPNGSRPDPEPTPSKENS